MEDTSKYLIHADVTAEGVVERSDVVGAIFGQTEGLLGDDLDLRDLRQSGKVGRIDVEISSRNGNSFGRLTIATSLDKVETATLAAALETITRVGPCRASLEVAEIEDVRAAKRREVVDRAKELLRTGFDDTVMSSEEILAEVREHVRVEDITEYEGLPAGPRVTDSDAIIVVEGRSDVLTLLTYGVKNAIAVEGTNVPDAVAELTTHRTVTAFLDGDRGGDLILEELAQVGEIDYVAFAPGGSSVEDLDHHEVFAALRNKTPYDAVANRSDPREAVAATDGSATPAPSRDDQGGAADAPQTPESPTESANLTRTESSPEPDGSDPGDVASGSPDRDDSGVREASTGPDAGEPAAPTEAVGADVAEVEGEREGATATRGTEPASTEPEPTSPESEPASTEPEPTSPEVEPASTEPESLYDHVTAVVREGTDRVRLLDADREVIAETDASEASEALADADPVPDVIVLDAVLEQQLLDRAADLGVSTIVARSLGQFVKRPTGVRVHAAADVAESAPES